MDLKRSAAILAVVLAAGCGQSGTSSGGDPRALASSRAGRKAAIQAAAANLSEEEKRVPHYFGPFPNWANSQFTYADARVVITGDGSGATATADVGAGGAITGITVTDPGNGYSWARISIVG